MINNPRSLSRLFLGVLLLTLSCFSNKSYASHFAAVDLYMDYIGTGPGDLKYKITLIVYKACEPGSIDLSTTESVSFSSTCASHPPLSMPTVIGPDTMDQLCANFAPVNACRVSGSVWPAFVRRIYSAETTLPQACTDWVVTWTNSARNSGIQNLQNPAGQAICVTAGINNVAKWNNSTPRFIIDPIPYLCQNQPAFFLNGPLDPNNDSMVTTNYQPAGNSCLPINYQAGYSLADPVATLLPSNPYTVNANTGTATFLPTVGGKFVLAFECREYDRTTGVELGFIHRDVQVSVLNCNASPPTIDTTPVNLTGGSWFPTPPSGGYLIACPGVPVEFNVSGESNTISNSVFLSSTAQQVIPNSVFTVVNQGTANPVGTFSWTPTGLDIGDYTVIFTSKDSTCNNNQPIVLKNYFVAFIKVLPGVDAGPDGFICKLDPTPWQLNVTGPPTATYVWTALGGGFPEGLSDATIPNPTAQPPYDYTYVVEATNFTSACKNRDTVKVLIDTSNSVVATPSETVVCRPGYLQLNSQGYGLAPLRNMPCGIDEIINCVQTDSTEDIPIYYSGGISIPSATYTPFPSFRTARIQILVRKDDLRKYQMHTGTIRSLSFNVDAGTNTQYHNFTISMKCTENTGIKDITGGMESGATLVYTAPGPVAVTAGKNEFVFDTPYSWDSTKNIIIEICYSNPAAGTGAIIMAANDTTSSMAIRYSNAGSTSICQNTSLPGTTIYYGSRPVVKFTFCRADTVPFPYTWVPGTYLSDSTSPNPLAYVTESTTYTVSIIGRNGCRVVDTVKVKVPQHDYDVWPYDTTFCEDQPFLLRSFGDYASVKWYEDTDVDAAVPTFHPATTLSCDDCDEAVGTPKVSTNYYAVMTDEDGCADTMVVRATVKKLPVVNILNSDTTLKYGQSMQLLVSGAYLYSWQPISSLTNPNVVNPVASPTEPTKYYVYGVAENGCRNSDSIMINVDYRDQLFVPSAFTPNGDGKNDVFRVANLTFQRLLEFRVFNRWGQEIFSTNDPRKGWDGSWKGVPQDMGAYQYLIRVAYPDGMVETYKGDVTLVR